MRRQVALCLVLGLPLVACDRATVTTTRGHPIPRDGFREVMLGRTTALEVEQRFGPAEQHDADGALRYRYTFAHRRLLRIAGWEVPFHAKLDVEQHEVVFRFKRGVLSRICESRHDAGPDAADDARRSHSESLS